MPMSARTCGFSRKRVISTNYVGLCVQKCKLFLLQEHLTQLEVQVLLVLGNSLGWPQWKNPRPPVCMRSCGGAPGSEQVEVALWVSLGQEPGAEIHGI